ncbi:MAG: lycopene cyclase domain-containing protein [Chloroflexi bacterium]|nr:lycopene cyclase domain-containing protein [Chloroflexota bacterium]
MSYFGFLLRFVVIPILLLGALAWWDRRQGRALPESLRGVRPWIPLAAMVGIALLYTTPWDNYLVATKVWWYDPALVTGITLGWVPIEEYTFFVLQPLLSGLWLLWLARRVRARPAMTPRPGLRWGAVAAVGLVWAASAIILIDGWLPGNYLALELVWALPPIALQLAVGADILWHYRRLVAAAIVSATLYLAATDALAIHSGTWTINPERSLGLLIGGVLPVEELLFFFLTNTLLVFGTTLALAQETAGRLAVAQRRWLRAPVSLFK